MGDLIDNATYVDGTPVRIGDEVRVINACGFANAGGAILKGSANGQVLVVGTEYTGWHFGAELEVQRE